MKKLTLLLLTILAFSDNLTIYNSNLANINTTKNFNVVKGIQTLEFPNFPSSIISDSIIPNFSKNITLLEQSFLSNRTSIESILKLNLKKRVKFYPTSKQDKLLEGELINTNPITIKANEEYFIINNPTDIIYKEYPKGLSKASIKWRVDAKKDLKESVQIDYLARGFNWYTNYVASLNKKTLNLKAFTTISNRSGKDFKDANVSLIAGKLNTDSTTPKMLSRAVYKEAVAVNSSVIRATKLSNYYKYKIPFKVNLLDNESKQIAIIDAKDVKYNSYGLAYNSNFSNYGKQKLNFKRHISFVNSKSNNLGLPLPQGKIRAYSSGVYIGESNIQNTPNKEKIDIAIGDLFDIVGEKIITKYIIKEKYRNLETTYNLKNRSKNSVTLKIKEQIPRYGNSIKKESSCSNICSKKDESAFVSVYTIELKPNSSYEFKSSFEIFR